MTASNPIVTTSNETPDNRAYLERIRYEGSVERNAHAVQMLQQAHLLTVPFENLSIHANEAIILDVNSLFDKIVTRKRGGFCYELNGLFAWLLRSLGFEVKMISAGVAKGDGSYSPDFDHMALWVDLEEPWLADVGFGDSFRRPLRINDRRPQAQFGRQYQINHDGEYYILMEQKPDEDWKPQYRFKPQSFQFSDYRARCLYHQTSPQSHFKQKRVCTRATADGRLTLSEMRLITTTQNGSFRQERNVASEGEYRELLTDLFGVVMTNSASTS